MFRRLLEMDLTNLVKESGFFDGRSLKIKVYSKTNFWYTEREDGGLDIFRFTDRVNPETAEFYRYSAHNIRRGVINLETDTASLSGEGAIRLMKELYC